MGNPTVNNAVDPARLKVDSSRQDKQHKGACQTGVLYENHTGYAGGVQLEAAVLLVQKFRWTAGFPGRVVGEETLQAYHWGWEL